MAPHTQCKLLLKLPMSHTPMKKVSPLKNVFVEVEEHKEKIKCDISCFFTDANLEELKSPQ